MRSILSPFMDVLLDVGFLADVAVVYVEVALKWSQPYSALSLQCGMAELYGVVSRFG